MSNVIVDTNVAVVANHQNAAVTERCVHACVSFLVEARESHVVFIDHGDEIRAEYAKALAVSPPMRLGALFLMHILMHQYNDKKVRRIDLKKSINGDFVDFPKVPELDKFDRDDRKFAALAKKTGTAVSNAIDSDWADHLVSLEANGIEVKFLCGDQKAGWFIP